MPYAACSRSHHPAPTPTNARPPDSASSVAAALAVMPAGRKVTGETSVPSRSRVSRPATSPRVTHGSGIGSQARSTCGIWIRWSITASPAKPASSAASAIDRSQPAGSSPHGKRETWSMTASPCDERRSSAGAVAGAGGSVSARESGVTTWTTSQPSSGSSTSRTSRNRLSWAASAVAGTTYARSALRRRVSSGGVSITTATAGRPAARAASRQARRRPGSSPRVSTTVVSPRERRAATMRSRISNASSVAARSCAPEPTTPRSSSDETTSAAR